MLKFLAYLKLVDFIDFECTEGSFRFLFLVELYSFIVQVWNVLLIIMKFECLNWWLVDRNVRSWCDSKLKHVICVHVELYVNCMVPKLKG